MYKASGFFYGESWTSEEVVEIKSPIDDSVVGSIPVFRKEQVDKAYDSAKQAFDNWSKVDYKTRVKYMLAFSAKLREHSSLIEEIVHLEIGKDKKSVADEVLRSAEYIVESAHAYADLVEHVEQYDYANNLLIPKNIYALYMRKPLGVVLSISPFNYPVNLMITKIVPALLVGNTVVHKSATNGSLVGWYITKLFHEVTVDGYLPTPGALNFVTGKGYELGDLLIKNPTISAFSFTGSTAVGLEMSEKLPLIPKQLEMGGHNPAVILKDADLNLTIKNLISGAFSFSGQRCTSIKRVFVDKSIKKEFLEQLKKSLNTLKLTEPLISKYSVNSFKQACDDAVSKGASYIGEPLDISGNYVSPVVLDGVKKGMILFESELFAPVIAITEYEKEDEIYDLCNDSNYGLQCSIFSQDTEKASKISVGLDFGRVNINMAPSRSPDILPFSGIKNSGMEVQGIKNSLYFFTRFQGLVLKKELEDVNAGK